LVNKKTSVLLHGGQNPKKGVLVVTALTIAESSLAVNYNRAARQWWVVDEEGTKPLADFPAGRNGKREAETFALANGSEAIFRKMMAIVEANLNHPEIMALENRAIKAAFMARDGHVLPPRPLHAPGSFVGEVARVLSQGEQGAAYAVVQSPSGLFCECQDWHNGRSKDILKDYYRKHPDDPDRPRFGAPKLADGTYACKHVLAYLIKGEKS
jgi:hypothetical protein